MFFLTFARSWRRRGKCEPAILYMSRPACVSPGCPVKAYKKKILRTSNRTSKQKSRVSCQKTGTPQPVVARFVSALTSFAKTTRHPNKNGFNQFWVAWNQLKSIKIYFALYPPVSRFHLVNVIGFGILVESIFLVGMVTWNVGVSFIPWIDAGEMSTPNCILKQTIGDWGKPRPASTTSFQLFEAIHQVLMLTFSCLTNWKWYWKFCIVCLFISDHIHLLENHFD